MMTCGCPVPDHTGTRPTAPAPRPSALPALLAGVLLALSLVAVVVRLDAPSDPTVLVLGRDTWSADGVLVDVLDGTRTSPLRSGDLVATIGDVRLSHGLGGLTPPREGDVLPYGIVRNGAARTVQVTMARPDVVALVGAGWGDLVFVVAFGALGLALYLRRRDEPATGPLLVLAAGLFGSTLVVVAGLPALALAVGGPRLVLFHLCSLAVYSTAWGGLAAFSLALTGAGDRRWKGRRATTLAYAAPPLAAALWALGTRIGTAAGAGRLGAWGLAAAITGMGCWRWASSSPSAGPTRPSRIRAQASSTRSTGSPRSSRVSVWSSPAWRSAAQDAGPGGAAGWSSRSGSTSSSR